MQLLLTRPYEEGCKTAETLRKRGFTVIHEPLIQVRVLEGKAPDLSGIQAVVVTSSNGVRALERRMSGRKLTPLPIYTVGEASARTAYGLGFTRVRSAKGNAGDLVRMLKNHVKPQDGALLHVTGQRQARDLGAMLAPFGYTLRKEIMYESHPVDNPRQNVPAQLQKGNIHIVMLYSPYTACIYSKLVGKAFNNQVLQPLHVCLSPAVAEEIQELGLKKDRIIVAASPQQDALFSSLPLLVPEARINFGT
ncbi:MAG: uroporphyrinogen-III synthase [Alphaproteobacteria bacterium]|nr:uroporphyrinogen-III synthase [Alphaproteobacteria bacterium]